MCRDATLSNLPGLGAWPRSAVPRTAGTAVAPKRLMGGGMLGVTPFPTLEEVLEPVLSFPLGPDSVSEAVISIVCFCF